MIEKAREIIKEGPICDYALADNLQSSPPDYQTRKREYAESVEELISSSILEEFKGEDMVCIGRTDFVRVKLFCTEKD